MTVESVNLGVDWATSTWLEAHDLSDVRVEASSDDGSPVFGGIAPQYDVDTWLAGAAHDKITQVRGDMVRYTRRDGTPDVPAPLSKDFGRPR